MSENTTTQETKVTLSVQQLESLIRKVVREELIELQHKNWEFFILIRNLRFMRIWKISLNVKKTGI